MEDISLKDLNLSSEESRDIIEFLARKPNVSNYECMTNEELLSTLKKTPKLGKRKNNLILTTQKPLKVTKLEKKQNLTLQKQEKTTKQEKSKNNQQQIKSENKERIEIIKEQLKELGYKLLRDELKEIKKHLYKIENKKGFLG